jgi:hypothetical protein
VTAWPTIGPERCYHVPTSPRADRVQLPGLHQGRFKVARRRNLAVLQHGRLTDDRYAAVRARICRCERVPSAHPYADFSIPFVINNGVRCTWASAGVHPLGGPDRSSCVQQSGVPTGPVMGVA